MIKPSKCYVIILSEEKRKDFLSFYEPFASLPPNPSISLFAKSEEVTVSLYKPDKKGASKALFQGEGAYKEARIWEPSLKENDAPSPKPLKDPLRLLIGYPQIGSDEVGTGDFFGPIEVCAAYLTRGDLEEIKRLGVNDSKKMDDEKIMSIGPSLIKRFPYSHLSLDNEKYNEISSLNNMNAIKAKMHNAALLKLHKRYPSAYLYQDQFAEENLYYSYLKDEKEVCRNILFSTKGESHFPAVALSSVIARYSFLLKMMKMGDKYGVSFPFGAGDGVNAFAIEFAKKHGVSELKKVAKINFKNYLKILDYLGK